MKKFLLVDFNPLYYRSYHALKQNDFKTSKGKSTFATYGFFRALFSWYKKLNPDYIIVCDDSRSFRKDLEESYKSNRQIRSDSEMFDQKVDILLGLSELGIPVLKQDGLEADDLIATLTHTEYWKIDRPDLDQPYLLSSSEIEYHVLTIDYDLLQLVSDNVIVHVFKTLASTETYTPKTMLTLKNCKPAQWSMFKAIVGDSSDNLRGVRGVGVAKVQEALQKYETLHKGIADSWSLIENKRTKALLEESSDLLEKNFTLMDLSFDKKQVIMLSEIDYIVYSDLVYFIEQLEFKSMIKDLNAYEIPKLLVTLT